MLKKMGARRRAAFLRALEASGNQTLAAEKAGVSRSWVCKERAANPAFDAEVRAAIESADAGLRGGEGNRPAAKGWGYLDGVELVVRGSNRRRVQVARARAGQWTARSERRFLSVLAATCNAGAAYAAAGKSKGSAYAHRKRWPGFDRLWREAIEAGAVRLEFGLAGYAMNPFAALELPDSAPVSLTPDQALHNLHMNKRQLFGAGRRPGLRGRPPTIEAVTERVIRAVEAAERARRLSEAEKAATERGFAARRPGGPWPRNR